MGAAFVGKAINSSAAAVTSITATYSPTAGNFIVGSATWPSQTIASPNIKDNLGNSATIIDNVSNAGGPTTTITFFFQSAASGVTGFIFTPPSAHANGTGIEIHEVSGVVSSSPLDGHSLVLNAASSTTQTCPSVTTTANGDYIYCSTFGSISGNSNITAAGGTGATFTLRNSDVNNNGGDSSAIQTTAGAVNGTFTIGAAQQYLNATVALKAAGTGAAPFKQTDWQLPVQPSRIEQTFTWGQNRKLLVGLDKLPFRQRDWPLPDRPEVYPYRSFEWGENRKLLIGQDRLPFRQRDWLLPVAPEPDWRRSWTLSLLQTTLTPSGAAPFRQTDWPLPAPPAPIEQTWTYTPLNTTLSLIFFPPFIHYFPVPDAPLELPRSWSRRPSLALTTVAGPMPFRQTDWPVPTGPEPDPRRSWTWSFNLNLIGQDALPFRQFDWPLPQTPPLLKTDQPPNFLPLTAIVVMPFRQTDWPLPASPEPDPRRSWAWSFNLNLIGKDQLPFRQTDWQLPGTPDPWRMGPVLPNLTLILPTPPPPPPVIGLPASNPFSAMHNFGRLGST